MQETRNTTKPVTLLLSGCAKTVSELHLFQLPRLLFERKQIPQIVVNTRTLQETMEPLEATALPWAHVIRRVFAVRIVSGTASEHGRHELRLANVRPQASLAMGQCNMSMPSETTYPPMACAETNHTAEYQSILQPRYTSELTRSVRRRARKGRSPIAECGRDEGRPIACGPVSSRLLATNCSGKPCGC